jgi:hypothetical protein
MDYVSIFSRCDDDSGNAEAEPKLILELLFALGRILSLRLRRITSRVRR